MTTDSTALPNIVTLESWRGALDEQIRAEKTLTRQIDAVSAKRRRLPMVQVDKEYVLAGTDGERSLLDLFDGRSQLIVYHFMFGTDAEEGCSGCSWVIDAMTHPAHLHARDTSLAVVSRASLEKLQRYRDRMGWSIRWLSSAGTEFNVDMGVTVEGEEWHGVSVFLRDGDTAYRTYFSGDRGVEHLGSHWTYLDLTPYGRQETQEDSPPGWPQTPPYGWQRRHDDYS